MNSSVSPTTQFRINVAGFLSVIAAVFTSDRAQSEAIEKLKQEILVNREETLKNREIDKRILERME